MLKNGWLLQKGICILQRNSRLMQKKICTDIRFQSSLLDLHHITGLLNSKKMCKFCLNVAKSNVFWSVTKQCKRPPQLFETNFDIVYNILFVPFFPFLKHYASKNYFVALLKTKIGLDYTTTTGVLLKIFFNL